MITNIESGTSIDEIAEDIYRINTPLAAVPGGFSFNQYLIVDEQPLLFHTGLRRIFPFVREAIERILPVQRLRYVGFSHFESDECGSLNDFLDAAPRAVPVCGRVAALVSVEDFANRAPTALSDGETLALGRRTVRWFDAPHVPHAWECGFLMEETTRTLLCGDLFTQGGSKTPALTESDVLGPSEEFRKAMDYYSHSKNAGPILERLAAAAPTTLACMHGSAWRGDGGNMIRALAASLDAGGRGAESTRPV
jgi:flavorubredoxin